MKFVKPQRPVTRVFIHCSASDSPEHDNVATIIKWHKARGFSTIGYHYYIDKAGTIHAGRISELVPAAQQGYNVNSLAICLGGLNKFTQVQLDALKDFCAQINKAYNGHITFHGHREVNNGKTCPNFDYKTLLQLFDVGKGLDQKGFMKL